MDSKVIKISDRALNDLHKMNSCINDYLFQIIVNDFSKTLDKFYKMVCYDVEFRIGTCLNRELKLHGSKEIYLLHEDIAKCINSSRPVVSKTLKKMQDEGMLLLKKGCITITDVDALKALVGEELCCGLPHFGGRTCCCGE
ncbi:MAG: helix-turn-helix domain-containing protein [Phascolarctobacterium sp.]|nr:helix-turn-helix domain-containing protein [Phascolarctobacterium sp.]